MKLSILLCVALIATLGAVGAKSTSTTVGQCSKQDEGVTYGVPSDCHQYVVCKKEKLQLKECESKYNYDTVTSKCVTAKNATCAVDEVPEEPQPAEPVPEEPQETDEQYDYLCVKVLYGVRIHPGACDKYLVCSKEKAKIEYCDDGMIFVADAIQCVKGNKNTCSTEQDEPSTTYEPPTTAATESKEKESEESEESSEGFGESSKETEGSYDYLCAKKLFGSVAHPESCTKYISCRKYKAKEENCKKGYYYASKLGLCVKQTNGQCPDDAHDPPSTTITTEAPTTVTKPTKPDSGESDSGESSKETEGPYDYLCAKKLLGSVAHPESCTKYISCKKYKAKEENCKKGYSYASKLGLCLKQSNGECADDAQNPPATTEEPTTVTKSNKPDSGESDSGENSASSPGKYDYVCVNVADGKQAHPDSCTKYISCKKHKAKVVNCKKGRYYSTYLQTCIKGNQETCAEGNGNPGTPATPPPSTVPRTTSLGSPGTPATPPPSTVPRTTSLATEAPTTPTETETTTSPPVSVTLGPSYAPGESTPFWETTTSDDSAPELTPPSSGGDPMEPSVECVEGFTGYLPIENDCTKYVYCSRGEPGQRSCLEKYIYYHPFKACLPGDSVLCQLYTI